MQKNIGTTNRSRTSDRMFSGDAYTSSKKQQFYFWLKPLSSNEWDSYGNQSGTSYASVNQVVTSVASAVSNWNTHKCSIARREERSIRSFAMSIAKHLMSRLRIAIRRRKSPIIQQKNEWTQKWPYEKDALARESTLCVAGTLIRWFW